MKIVVTGGAGFIGKSFLKLCNAKGHDTVLVDSITYAGSLEGTPKSTTYILEDINKVKAKWIKDADYIVNFAAETHVDNSIKNGNPFVKSNVNGVFNLLEVSRNLPKLKKFIQISTDEVYGDLHLLDKLESNEKDTLHPSSYYSATKAAADMLVMSCNHTYGLPYLITRTCNNFGDTQHSEKFIPTIARNIVENKPVPLYGDGEQIREWIWVEDNVRIIYDLMFKKEGIWNIGSGKEGRWKNNQIIKYISKMLDKKVIVDYVEDRKGHDKRYSLDINKLKTEYIYEPIVTKSLKTFLEEVYGQNN